MKLCAIQPPYAHTPDQAEASVDFIIQALNECDESCDLILTPEYSNAPCALPVEEFYPFIRKHTARLVEAARMTARRCNAIVALSHACEVSEGVFQNLTRVYDRSGEPAGDYSKQHLTFGEVNKYHLDNGYTRRFLPPSIVEVDGLRLGFLICYDTYFTEYVAHLSSLHPDIVLVSSFQRGERQDILRMQNQMIAFNCNSYVLRASLSMGADSECGGTSLAASPDGRLLGDFGNRTGLFSCVIENPHWKYSRSNTFGGAPILNDRFIEQGRTPWSCRPCGSMTIPGDRDYPYPRICAHRGFSTMAPENTLPAFGAAIALGAPEIELDVRFTKDGVPVSVHDRKLERISNGIGFVDEKTFEELQQLDFSGKYAERLSPLPILPLESVLAKYARQVIINMHIKGSIEDGHPNGLYPLERFRKIVELIDKYDMRQHVYFMSSADVLQVALAEAPDIPRCMGAAPDGWTIVDRAIECKCAKVQLFKPYFNQEMIDRAHQNGILCNVFWSDDPEEARQFLKMGIDCILTNDYWKIANALKY